MVCIISSLFDELYFKWLRNTDVLFEIKMRFPATMLIIFNLIFDLLKIPLFILLNQQIKSRQKVDNDGNYVKN